MYDMYIYIYTHTFTYLYEILQKEHNPRNSSHVIYTYIHIMHLYLYCILVAVFWQKEN